MPEIHRKKHDANPGKEEDIELKINHFRLYFQNKYSLISLINDLITGIFYLIASISRLTSIPDVYGTYLYLIGAIFLTARPVLKIINNIFIYDEKTKEEREEQKDAKENEEYNEDYYGKDNNKEYEEKEKSDKKKIKPNAN